MKRSGTEDKWKEERNKKATRVGVFTNSARERHTREADKQWTRNRNDERIEREKTSQARRTTIWNVQGTTREKMVADGGRWKEQRSTGKTINYQESFESNWDSFDCFSSVRKPIFAISFERAGYPTGETERGTKSTTERERERAKWEKDLGYFTQTPGKVFRSERSNVLLLSLSLWPHFVHQRTPQPCDPSGKGIDSCSVLCAITTTLEYKSTAPIEPTEMSSSRGAPRIERRRWDEAAFNCGTKKIDRHDDCDVAVSMFRGKLGV